MKGSMNYGTSTLEQKIKWLLTHRNFLVGKTDYKKLAAAMKYDHLLAPSTYWPDAKSGMEEAVKQAKFRWYAEHNGREITP
jgi:hypothetical protein